MTVEIAQVDYVQQIARYQTHQDLLALWQGISAKDTPGWPPGRALDYCLQHQSFRQGLLLKYQWCVERAIPFYNEELIGFSKTKRIRVVLAVPEVEILLFQERAILEELLDCEISDVDWARAEFIPRTILQKLLTQFSEAMTLEQLLDQLTPAMIDKLRNHPLLQEITISFLSGSGCLSGATSVVGGNEAA